MKKVVLFAFMAMCVSFSVFSQEAEQLSFSKVIQAKDAKKDVIYAAIMDWLGTNFQGLTNDSQLSDKDAGMIIKQAGFYYDKGGVMYSCYKGFVYYKMKFQIRDERFKVELTAFVHEINKGNSPNCELGIITTAEEYKKGGLQKGYNNNVWKDIKEKAEEIANGLFYEIGKLKFDSFAIDKNDDW